MPEGFVNPINPSTVHPLNQTFPVGLVNPTYISMTFLSYSAALVLVFETIAGAERKRVEKINTNARIAAKFSSCKRQLLKLLIDISNVKPFPRSPIQHFNVLERFTPHPSRFTRKKAAFTLAEVLITLGIIGIVAAMTLPAVVNNIQNKQLETALKKSYSLLSQVTQRVVMEDFGGMIDAENGKEISSYFVKHYKNGNICGSGKTSGCPVTTGGDEACNFMRQNYKNFNGKSDGGCVGNDIISNTIDSTTLYFDAPKEGEGAETEENILMAVDVNGWQKKPNRWGHDMFLCSSLQKTENFYLWGQETLRIQRKTIAV